MLKPGKDSASIPGFLRRLGAIFYDFILLIAVLFLATALLLPFNAGEAFTSSQILYPLYLLAVSFFFYGWFWTHGGQTLGLRTWKIKVLTFNRQTISWQQALVRFLTAIVSWGFFGLGFLWILFDKNKLSWHDHLSQTTLFFDSKDK
ncbi:MAG: RDD family protein [Methylococcaceae bacterium]